MKKIIIAIVALVVVFSTLSSALAVEKVAAPAAVADAPVMLADSSIMQTARFVLANTGELCGLLSIDENRPVLPLDETASKHTGYSRHTGKLVRAKNTHLIRLDENNKLSAGSSELKCTIQVIDQGMLTALGLTNVADVIDATIVAIDNNDGTYRAFHRFTDTDRGNTEVARITFNGSDRYASIRIGDWNGDGQPVELMFRAGTYASKSSSSGGNGGGSSSGGNGGGSTGGGNGGGDSMRPPVQGSNNSYNDMPDSGRAPVQGSNNSFSDIPNF